MYVADNSGNVIIGTRAGQRMPHPTLVGGNKPEVQAVEIVDIRGISSLGLVGVYF